jgi:hypothetical protein
MNKSFEKTKSQRASMDSISVPDTEKIRKLNDTEFKGRGINKTADDIFDGNRFNKVGDFDRATKYYESPSDKKAEEEEEEFDDFLAKTDPNRKAPDAMNQGVKVGGQYVKRKKIIMWIIIAVVVLVAALLFLPPVASDRVDDSGVIRDDNVFQGMGMTELKTYALSNYSVYNEAAFSSEKTENYRVVKIVLHFQNSSPFETTIPQVEVTRVPSKYKDKICYATVTTKDSTGAIVGEIIPAFSSKDIEVDVMVNVEGMTDDDLDKAVTGMVLSTTGTKKKIAVNTYVPCLPVFIPVSNNITVTLSD